MLRLLEEIIDESCNYTTSFFLSGPPLLSCFKSFCVTMTLSPVASQIHFRKPSRKSYRISLSITYCTHRTSDQILLAGSEQIYRGGFQWAVVFGFHKNGERRQCLGWWRFSDCREEGRFFDWLSGCICVRGVSAGLRDVWSSGRWKAWAEPCWAEPCCSLERSSTGKSIRHWD